MSKRLGTKQLYTTTVFEDFDIEHAFKEFNSKYFRFGKHKLARLLGVFWDKTLVKKGLLGMTSNYYKRGVKKPDNHRIHLNPQYKGAKRIWMLTLLHEMVHFEIYDEDTGKGRCGSRMFNARMKELANAGALNGLW